MKIKGMEKAADLISLNLLFLLCSIPVVTMGAASTAMHYALRRWQEEQGSILRDFWKSLKQNFGQATLLWLLFLALAAVMGLNFWIIGFWTGPVYYVFMVLLMVMAYILLLWVTMVFPFLARFDNSTGQIAKNALLLALFSPARSFCALIINLFPIIFAILLPKLFLLASVLWLLILYSASGLLIQFLFAPVFDKISK